MYLYFIRRLEPCRRLEIDLFNCGFLFLFLLLFVGLWFFVVFCFVFWRWCGFVGNHVRRRFGSKICLIVSCEHQGTVSTVPGGKLPRPSDMH